MVAKMVTDRAKQVHENQFLVSRAALRNAVSGKDVWLFTNKLGFDQGIVPTVDRFIRELVLLDAINSKVVGSIGHVIVYSSGLVNRPTAICDLAFRAVL